jgi:hypothetical protein
MGCLYQAVLKRERVPPLRVHAVEELTGILARCCVQTSIRRRESSASKASPLIAASLAALRPCRDIRGRLRGCCAGHKSWSLELVREIMADADDSPGPLPNFKDWVVGFGSYEIAHRVARDRTNAARERTSTDEAERLPN